MISVSPPTDGGNFGRVSGSTPLAAETSANSSPTLSNLKKEYCNNSFNQDKYQIREIEERIHRCTTLIDWY